MRLLSAPLSPLQPRVAIKTSVPCGLRRAQGGPLLGQVSPQSESQVSGHILVTCDVAFSAPPCRNGVSLEKSEQECCLFRCLGDHMELWPARGWPFEAGELGLSFSSGAHTTQNVASGQAVPILPRGWVQRPDAQDRDSGGAKVGEWATRGLVPGGQGRGPFQALVSLVGRGVVPFSGAGCEGSFGSISPGTGEATGGGLIVRWQRCHRVHFDGPVGKFQLGLRYI